MLAFLFLIPITFGFFKIIDLRLGMKKLSLFARVINVFSFILVTACTSFNTTEPRLVGSDRDSHGCIGSAGYQWCDHQNQCVRSWELAAEKGLANSPEAFESYCNDVH